MNVTFSNTGVNALPPLTKKCHWCSHKRHLTVNPWLHQSVECWSGEDNHSFWRQVFPGYKIQNGSPLYDYYIKNSALHWLIGKLCQTGYEILQYPVRLWQPAWYFSWVNNRIWELHIGIVLWNLFVCAPFLLLSASACIYWLCQTKRFLIIPGLENILQKRPKIPCHRVQGYGDSLLRSEKFLKSSVRRGTIS
jgi:hypothetical protein